MELSRGAIPKTVRDQPLLPRAWSHPPSQLWRPGHAHPGPQGQTNSWWGLWQDWIWHPWYRATISNYTAANVQVQFLEQRGKIILNFRKFTSFRFSCYNNCTLHWFQQWSLEALGTCVVFSSSSDNNTNFHLLEYVQILSYIEFSWTKNKNNFSTSVI